MRRCPAEPKAVVISSEGVKRTTRQGGRILTALEDRVGPYETPPSTFSEWLKNRLLKLAEHYNVVKR